MRGKKLISKTFALLLMLTILFPNEAAALAEGAEEPINQGVVSEEFCPHHSEHTLECGFVQGSESSPCQHVHDDSCGYAENLKELNCGHIHDDSCGYAEATAETACDMGCTDTDGDGIIEHTEGCAYAPATEGSPCQHVHDDNCYTVIQEGSPCQHVHDDNCGYAPPVEGKPCTFSCDICGADDAMEVSVQTLNPLSPEILQQTVPAATSLESLLLPGQLEGMDENWKPLTISGIAWISEPAYNGSEGNYVFTPRLPVGCTLAEGVELPRINVTVLKAETRDAVLAEVYWDFQEGDDNNTGETIEAAVKSFERAKELLAVDGTIYICSPVQVSGAQTWSLADKGNATLQRKTSFMTIELMENASLTLENITINGIEGQCEYPAIYGNGLCTLILNSGCVIQNNHTEYMGAAICGWEGMQLIMNAGAVIQNCSTIGAHYGGGVFLANNSNFIMNGGEIKNNAANRGGAIALIGSSMTMNGGSICGNSTYNVGNDGYGGAIYIADYEAITAPGTGNTPNDILPHEASFTMTNGIISGNTSAADGGGILTFPQGNRESGYSKQSITVKINGGTISNNTANSGDGGGITMYYTESKLEIGNGGSVSGNVASNGNGGGIFLAGVEDAHFTDGVVSSNRAEKGAGIYIGSLYDNGYYYGSQVQLAGNSQISSNRASESGGGIYIDQKSTLLMSDGTITSNTSGKQGGGIYLTYASGTKKVTAKITGGTISGNQAMEHMDYRDASGQWMDYTNTFSNGICLGTDATLQFGGTAVIDQKDDIAIDSETWDLSYGSYIQVINNDWDNGGGKVSITSQSTKVPKYVIEYPETNTKGSKLVSYNDESGTVSNEHSQAAESADISGLFVPSVAMLEVNPTLAIGQSKIDGRTNIMTYVAPFVTISPADVTIYVGGSGYTGVVDNGGQAAGNENGFPVPGFVLSGIPDFNPAEAVLKYDDDAGNQRQWTIASYDGNSEASHGIYRFVANGTTTAVRMQFEKTDGEGNGTGEIVTEDSFTVSDNLDQDLIMEVYGEGIDSRHVTLEYKGVSYTVKTGTGMLKVRSTSNNVRYGNLSDPLKSGEPGLKASDATVYYINGKSVMVADTEGVALLFDSIIENNDSQYSNTQLLIQRGNQELNAAPGELSYELKYLDLVDRKNGNVWLTASEPVTIYWPLPEGTTKETEFKLLHFKGMDREMGVDEVEDDILSTGTVVENLTDKINVTDEYIVFNIDTEGFSPFGLAWPAPKTTGGLTVSKTVSGVAGETNRAFNFSVTLDDGSISGTYGDMSFVNGVAELSLKHGESKTADGLSEGIAYSVTEVEANMDGYSTTAVGATGTVTAGTIAKAEFTNKRDSIPAAGTGGLKVTKTVKGNAGDTGRYFNFILVLDDRNISGVYEQMSFVKGVAEFSLKHGESKTADGLPEGITYSVTEIEANRRGYSTVVVNGSGSIQADSIIGVEFINTRNHFYSGLIPHTGDSSNLGLWIALGGLSLLAIAGGGTFLWLRYRKSKSKENGKQP